MELVTRQSERSGHQQRLIQAFTEDVFIFSSTNLLTYLLMQVLLRWPCNTVQVNLALSSEGLE